MRYLERARNWHDNSDEQESHLAMWGILCALISQAESQHRMADALERIADVMAPPPGPTIGLRVVAILRKGDNTPMPPIAPISCDLQHDVLYTTDPKNADGTPNPNAALSWMALPPGLVNLVISADQKAARAVTLAEGVVTVSVTDGSVTDTSEVTIAAVAPPPPGTINLAGQVVDKQP